SQAVPRENRHQEHQSNCEKLVAQNEITFARFQVGAYHDTPLIYLLYQFHAVINHRQECLCYR
ncbi:MAG TPA: hypothetical protein PK498_04425, partial [Candidatus Kapabacteria bacterium]|nr:hypothetical protein [Candidatus Kapabacteria bacterium]